MGTYIPLHKIDRLLTIISGYNMARNLQAKLPASDTIRIYDINTESLNRFAQETKALGNGADVSVANSVRDAAEDSVCFAISFPPYFPI